MLAHWRSWTVALVVGLLAVTLVAGIGQAQSGEIPPDRGDCEQHPPIEITEDTGQQGFVLTPEVQGQGLPVYRPGSGVVFGTGTAENPYIIEDWCITPDPDVRVPTQDTSGADAAITIQNTDAHVLVRDNVLPAEGDMRTGVRLVNAENVEILGNEIAGNEEDGIHVDGGQQVEIRANTIEDNSRDGVRVDDAGWTGQIEDNTVEANDEAGVRLTDVDRFTVEANTIADNGDGIRLTDSQDITVRANELLRTAAFDAIRLYDADENTITGNRIELTGHGIGLFADSSANRVEDNEIVGVGGHGIEVSFSPSNEIVDNEIRDGGSDGIRLAGQATEVRGNDVRRHDVGIHVSDDADPGVIDANHLADNRIGLDIEAQPAQLKDNDIQANDIGLAVDGLDQSLDAKHNWWGDASGPSGGVQDACTGTVADGSGDPIEVHSGAGVCFEPWLAAGG